MNKFCQTIAVSFAILTASQNSTAGVTHSNKKEYNQLKQFHKNRRLLVKYKDESSPINNKAHFSAGAYIVKSFDSPKIDVVEVAKGISIKAAIKAYENNPKVAFVEPDYELKAFFTPPPFIPPWEEEPKPPIDTKDPNLSEQWGLNNIGQNQGKNDADINASEAWEQLSDTTAPVIAVIDTGLNYKHPDLIKNSWINTEEIPNNGIDDDNNGVIDDVHGFNASSDNGDPMDDHGHGSHCSGIIAAEHNNPYGGRGLLPNAQIIGCKFLDANGSGSTSDAIECLEYLLKLKNRPNNPVNIVASSNSWGGSENSEALKDAIKAHQDAGILFIAAASNDYANNDLVDTYPSDYDLSNVISVAASDRKDTKADFSNFGKHTVHVAAPGAEIFSTVLGDKYDTWDGTSMATPFVSGLAGMIKIKYPHYDYKQIRNLIISSGTPVDSLKDLTISGRRIRAIDTNGQGALSCANQIVTQRLTPVENNFLVGSGGTISLSVMNINCEQPNGDVVITDSSGNAFTLLDNGEGADKTANDGVYSGFWSTDAAGIFTIYFPNNETLTVNVYDSSLLKPYTNEEEEFNYRSIEGTNLNLGDDTQASITLDFPIAFGGYSGFTELHISSNGVVSFSEADKFDFDNTALPLSDFTTFIAPYWDDLSPNDKGNVYYAVIGEAPNRELVIEWRNVERYGYYYDEPSTKTATFQVVFFENSSDVLFNYLDIDLGSVEYGNGGSATIGLQTNPDIFTQYSFNQTLLSSNKAIRFKKP